jgi:inner membrane protein
MAFGDGSHPTAASRAARSPGLKILVIVGLTVLMALPLFLIQMALNDRQNTASGAATDIAQGYGGPQTVAGPLLLVPYAIKRTDTVDGKTVESTVHYTAALLPDDLKIGVKADTATRYRGIFPVPVYRAAVDLAARFDKTAILAALPEGAEVDWKNTAIDILVTDARGLADNVAMTVNGRTISFEPGAGFDLPTVDVGGGIVTTLAGMQAKLDLTGPEDLKLATKFVLRGSREFSLTPLGRRTVAAVQSEWASPSFFGAFLPSERQVTKDGFTASWTVPYLARGFGQSFASSSAAVQAIMPQAFGARFYQPVDHYQLVQRALKYAILFVALAFLVFFVAETVSGRRIHVVQYAMTGAAQVLFYLLLLSIAEHLGFAASYAIAAGATVVLTGFYAVSAFHSLWRGLATAVVLAALYAMLYVILNSEDNALLTGSCVLFAALAGTMWFTRKIDWYRVTDGTGTEGDGN